jgi:RNA polymerase sigma-70 factor (ECF subfamily)
MENYFLNSRRNGAHWDDLELAERAAGGDRTARTRVAERMYNRVRSTVRYLSADHRDQDDWVQLVIVEILDSLRSFRGDSSLEAWGNRIAIRKTMRLIKTRRGRDRIVALEPELLDSVAEGHGQEARHLIRRRLARALGAISPKYRVVIVLRTVYEYSVDDIAQIVETPRNTVRQRLRRGRKMLAEKLSKDPVFEDWVATRDK